MLASCVVPGVGAGLDGSGVAHAQTSAEGSIRGYVKDGQGAVLPGVLITASSPSVGRAVTAHSDESGFYRLLGLQPATYTITAELQGFAKLVRENVDVRAGLNLSMELVLEVGDLSEIIQVEADTPMLEASSASQGVNVKGEFQRSLALSSRRNWADFLALTPGVTTLLTTGNPNVYSHGSDVGAHVFQMDGIDVTGGSLASPVYSFMSSEVLQDVQVKTGGVEASAPLGQGAVVNMVTRSGSNELHGGGFLVWQERGWSSNNNPGGTTSAFKLVQPDVSIGGPVAKDRVWFFGSYRRTQLTQGISRTPQQVATLTALAPDFEPTDTEQRVNATYLKVNAQLGLRHQLMGFYERSWQQTAFASATVERPFARSFIGGPSAAARLTSIWGDALTSRIAIGYNNLTNPSELFSYTTTARQVHQTAFLSAGRLTGSGVIASLDNSSVSQDSEGQKLTVTVDVNRYYRGLIGTHDFGVGAYLQPRRKTGFPLRYTVGPDGVTLEELVPRDANNLAAGLIPFHRQVYESDRSILRRGNASDYAFYLQDNWKPSGRLTITAGVRVDRIQRRDLVFDVELQRTTAIGPRVGVNYLITADGRNAVRASWGRVHESSASGGSQTAGTNQTGWTDYYDLNLDGTFETALVTPTQNALSLNRQFDLEGYHQPHTDDWNVGYQRQLPGLISVDVSFVRRRFADIQTSTEVNGIYDGSVFRGYRDEAFNDIFMVTSNRWNAPVYTGLQVQVTKQTARFQALAGYTRQWRHLDGTWVPNDPASFIQPDAFPNDKGLGTQSTATATSSLSGTDMTFNQKWRDHTARFAIVAAAPWQMRVSASWMLMSGLPSGPVVTRLGAADPQFGPSSVTLSNGRVVTNPLATVLRFAYPTRGEGQLYTPWVSQVNLHVGRQFQFSGLRLEPGVELLNIGNSGGDQEFISGGNQQYNPNYGRFTNRQPPRSAQVSLRVTF